MVYGICKQWTEDILSVGQMLDRMFDELEREHPSVSELREVFNFIKENLKEIDCKHIKIAANDEQKIIIIDYYLPDDMTFVIFKPLDTMDDNNVIFSLYHNRERLISELVDIELVAKYVEVTKKYRE